MTNYIRYFIYAKSRVVSRLYDFMSVHRFLARVLIISFLFMAAARSQAQTMLTVNGTLLHENGEPASVTVTVQGKKQATMTNKKGEFRLSAVPEHGILLISGVNVETFEVSVNGRNDIGTIRLKSKITQAEEVVIEGNTGYQKVRPNEVNGSIVVIDNKALNQQTGTNILKRLDGISSGVLFDNNKVVRGQLRNDNISIRGLSTINGSAAILVVLDGFIYEGDISSINPNDIDNVTILKDASAASIWGARAGNGVVVLTSKKGRLNQKAQVGINANIILTKKPDLGYLPQMPSSDYIDVEQFLFDKGFFNSRIDRGFIALTPGVEIMLDKRNGEIDGTEAENRLNLLKTIDSRDQYKQYAYRESSVQQYAVNVRGGSTVNAYTFSTAFDKTNGELRNTLNKLNLRLDNTFKPFKNLDINVGAYYTNSKAVSGIPGYNSVVTNGRQVPYMRLVDESGDRASAAIALREKYTDTVGAGKLLNWRFYPLENYKHDVTTTRLQKIYAIAGLQYKIAPYLNVALNYQYQRQQIEVDRLSDLESFSARNSINLYSQVDPSAGIVQYIVPVGGIKNVNRFLTQSHTLRGQINFAHAWGKHSVSSLAGVETREAENSSDNITVYGYKEDPLTYSPVDMVNPYPVITTGGYSYIPGAPSFSRSVNRFVSLYANASYTFNKKYSLSASVRRDGSNIFGLSSNDKWRPLWSAGAGWKISDEEFFSRSIFSSLRLRMTYGYSGNVDLSRSAEAVAGYLGGAPVTNFPYSRIFTLNNPGLRWEKAGIFNIGMDFSFGRDVFTGSIEYYQKKSTDLYAPSPYDYTAWGFASVITKNVAELQGRGVDVTLTSKNIDRKIQWTTTLLFNYNTDKTTKYEDDAAKAINSKLGSGMSIIPQIGKPLYSIASYRWGGLDSAGNPQGYVDNKKSTDYNAISMEGSEKGLDGNIVYIGPSRPPVFGSVINNFSWKGLSLAFNINYRFGYYFQRPSISYSTLVSSGTGHKDFARRWQKPGDELHTSVPSFIYPANDSRDNFYQASEVLIERADHIRLQYVNLGYTMTTRKGRSLPFADMTIYANAANLGLLWKASDSDLDPEYPNAVYPPVSVTIGLRANF